MVLSETEICNAALAKIGSKRINDIDADSSLEAIYCRTHYEMTRDSLIRSHYWRFASARSTLSQETTDPDFEWDNQFKLPTDFLRMHSIYEDRFTDENYRSYKLEGQLLLTNESTMEIRYIKKVTNVTEFDSLFVELLVLYLALKLVGSLGGGAPRLQEVIQQEIAVLMPQVKALDSQETNTIGRYDLETWNDGRYSA